MKIKKLVSFALCLCLLVALLCGCGKEKDYGLDPNKPTTITIWHYYNGVQQENFDHLIQEFNETVGHEKGIVVEARSKGSVDELSESVLASLRQDMGAEAPPDMFGSYAETAYIADQMGYVVNLSKYFTEEELSEYVDGYLEEGNFGNEDSLKIFPIAKSTEVLMINLTDWQSFADATRASLDALDTWEGLAETAEKYYKYTDQLTPDIPNDGKAFFGRDSVANYMIVGAKQLDLEYFTVEDGSFTMNENKEAIRRLWDCYYVPYVKGYYSSSSRFRSDDVKIGEIIAMVCSTTGATYFPDSVTLNDEYTYPIEGIVLPVPNFEGTDSYIVQQGAGMVVVKSTETKEYACAVFLKWFTEKERSIDFSSNSGYLPVKKEANDYEAIADNYETDDENDIMLQTIAVAVDEIDSCQLYAAKPFDKSAEARDFLGSYIQDSAQSTYDEVVAKIAAGEDRDKVLEEYTSDAAFDAWYEEFISGLQRAVGM